MLFEKKSTFVDVLINHEQYFFYFVVIYFQWLSVHLVMIWFIIL